MPQAHAHRRERLAEELAALELEAALVTDLLNVRYLTGFTGSTAVALVAASGETKIATDGRYEVQVAFDCPDVEAVITRAGRRELATRAVTGGAQRIGFEDRSLSVAAFRDLPHAPDWTPLGDAIERLRMVKDEAELDALRQACTATSDALQALLPRLRAGVTERQVSRWLDDELRERSEGPGFDTIVASGPNGAIPHHTPGHRVLVEGDLVTIDFGARVAGYHADMTRTVLIGSTPADWQREVYDVVQQAQAAGVDALTATAVASEVDAVAREVIEAAGMGDCFVHGLGHGVGLQIHEAPYLGSTSTDKLTASVPLTVEPGVYIPGRGGVRIEDTVVVHRDRVESLTTLTHDLLTLD